MHGLDSTADNLIRLSKTMHVHVMQEYLSKLCVVTTHYLHTITVCCSKRIMFIKSNPGYNS